MSRYRKKPVEVDAMQWTGDNIDALWEWGGAAHIDGPTEVFPTTLMRTTIDNVKVPCPLGHWVIRESKRRLKSSRFYPCDPDVFEATYEAVSS